MKVRLLREQVRHLYDKLFDRKSEKSRYGENSPQLPLFDMPEPEPEPASETAEPETMEVKSYSRRKRGGQPLPEAPVLKSSMILMSGRRPATAAAL